MNEYRSEGGFSAMMRGGGNSMFPTTSPAGQNVVFGSGATGNSPFPATGFPAAGSNSGGRDRGGNRSNSPMFQDTFTPEQPVVFGSGAAGNSPFPAAGSNSGGRDRGVIRNSSQTFQDTFTPEQPVVFGSGVAGNSPFHASESNSAGRERGVIRNSSQMFQDNFHAEQPVVFGSGAAGNSPILGVGSNAGVRERGGNRNNSSILQGNFPPEQPVVFGSGAAGNAPFPVAGSNSGGRDQGGNRNNNAMFQDTFSTAQVFGSGAVGHTPFPAAGSNSGGRERGGNRNNSQMFQDNSTEKPVVFGSGAAGNAPFLANGSNSGGREGGRNRNNSPMFQNNFPTEKPAVFGSGAAGNAPFPAVGSNSGGRDRGGNRNSNSMFQDNLPTAQLFGNGAAGNTSFPAAGSNPGGRERGGSRSNSPMSRDNSPSEQGVVFGSGAAGNRGGRDRARSSSPNFNPTMAASVISGQQDASKSFTKSDEQQSEEEAAKARRLARFSAVSGTRFDVARPASMADDDAGSMINSPFLESSSRALTSVQTKGRDSAQAGGIESVVEQPVEMEGGDNSLLEPILGICPDMCPEVERSERERKGDLDKFERVGGNRSQTSRELAVKKYTRTAEKDAVLIRPLPVLKKTMDHLLSLLERDHDDDLLAVHSFLWDRMRAVRMDLRMQHIFTDDAITMHEQMIRFHILAMHELCELSQGEGMSEVFNAHLNIEQMNKASVDLFQMYEDHAKRGHPVVTEAEFRGYYALLKLDKHPGYVVEPAELSLDLAKMTRDIRNSSQVLFARNVARACRASNYVAFFRLAREATYLQSCLMHAHFSKLRTQALASLHSGLQRNQGIPLSTITNWIGMEGEDVENFITYHGFSMKYYEEPYVVKEGPFLNKTDFPTSRALLVEAKRSLTVVEDVQRRIPETKSQALSPVKITGRKESFQKKERDVTTANVETPQLAPVLRPKEKGVRDDVEEPVPVELGAIDEVRDSPIVDVVQVIDAEEIKKSKKRHMEELQFEIEEHERRRLQHEADAAARRAAAQAAAQAAALEMKREEEARIRAGHEAEAFAGKQSLWFRKWKRRAASRVLERQRKLEQTEAALDALSLGYPLSKVRVQGESLSLAQRSENVEALMEEQGLIRQHLWESLNIPKLVGPILQELNPKANFLYWKLLLSIPSNSVGMWVKTKVGSRRELLTGKDSEDQVESSITLTEENVLLGGTEQGVVDFWFHADDLGSAKNDLQSTAAQHGAGGLLFVMDENASALSEKVRLHSLIRALPDGADIPLLILGLPEQKQWERLLKLDELSKSKVKTLKIVPFLESSGSIVGRKGYFSDRALREGLVWLAKLCPVQPLLRSLHVADLVKEHVDEHFKVLGRNPHLVVNPDHCISMFNQAIQNAAAEIGGGAWSSSGQKKCENGGHEFFLSRLLGNSKETLETVYADLNSCLLPEFPPLPLSTSRSIMLQKLRLEKTLLQFCTLIEGTGSERLATKWEVSRMVQRGCTVEWSESGRKLVPDWTQIFEAIFSSQLLVLERKSSPLVYIARLDKTRSLQGGCDNWMEINQILTSLDPIPDVPLLLDEVVGDDCQTDMPTESESAASPEKSDTHFLGLESPSLSRGHNSHLSGSAMHQWESSSHWTGSPLTDFRVMQLDSMFSKDGPSSRTHSILSDSGLEMQHLAWTPSEKLLDEMLADLKHEGNGHSKDSRARKVDLVFTPTIVPPVEDHSGLNHPSHKESLRGEVGSVCPEQVPVASMEVKESSREFMLMTSPFEVAMDEMLAEFSQRNFSTSPETAVGTFTPNKKFCSRIEEHKFQFRELQCSSWSV